MSHGKQQSCRRGRPISGIRARPVRHDATVERELTQWERDLLSALAAAPGPQSGTIRESIPHLVWTGGCECGCASFNVRDSRYAPPPHELFHYSNGWTPDKSIGFAFYLGDQDRPLSVDVFTEPEHFDARPDPATIVVEPAGP